MDGDVPRARRHRNRPLIRSVAAWLNLYNDAGQLEERTDARGVLTEYDYDDAGNLTQLATPSITIDYTFDELNRRKTMTGGGGTTTWSYDDASRVTSVQAPNGTVGYGYDDAGRRTSMTLPSGTVTYGYFDDGRVASVSEPSIGTIGFTYFEDGRPKTVTRPNGVTTTDGYDAAGRLTSVTHTKGGSPVASFSYVLDENGNRRSMTSAAGTETYTINELNQLARVTLPGGATTDYTYDAAGNRRTKTAGGSTTTYTYDDASQMTAVNGASYTYDASGNRLTGGGTSYSYDSLGRLAGATVGGTATTYTLDGDGRRVASTTGGTTTPYLWDMVGPFDELVSDGSKTYLQVEGSLLAETSASSVAYPLADALGSVRAMTDATGAVVGTASYDAFGARTSQTGASSIFGFAGEMQDPAGVYLRARTLDPTTGIFTQVDPMRPGAPGVVGYNEYSYVGNNPTTWSDPTGLMAEAAAIYRAGPAITTAAILTALGYTVAVAIASLALILSAVLLTQAIQTAVAPPVTLPRPSVNLPNVGKLIDELMKLLGLTRDVAIAIAASCSLIYLVTTVAVDANTLCSGRHIAIFVTGGDVMQASAHDLAAILFLGKPAILTKGPNGSRQGWYNPTVCKPPPGGLLQCDEYPFISTMQGGKNGMGIGSHVLPISAVDNMAQGRKLGGIIPGNFYTECGIVDGVSYLVVPAPLPGVPTRNICKR